MYRLVDPDQHPHRRQDGAVPDRRRRSEPAALQLAALLRRRLDHHRGNDIQLPQAGQGARPAELPTVRGFSRNEARTADRVALRHLLVERLHTPARDPSVPARPRPVTCSRSTPSTRHHVRRRSGAGSGRSSSARAADDPIGAPFDLVLHNPSHSRLPHHSLDQRSAAAPLAGRSRRMGMSDSQLYAHLAQRLDRRPGSGSTARPDRRPDRQGPAQRLRLLASSRWGGADPSEPRWSSGC